MPELPEVETIRRDLARLVVGKRLSRVDILDERVLQGFLPSGARRRNVSAAAFSGRVAGRLVQDVLRRGKYLIFELAAPAPALLCHLRMTGQLIYGPARPEARARLFFDGTGNGLNFCDSRRFGEIWLAEDWRRDPAIRALGPEPLTGEWDVAAWAKSLRSSRAKIQAALLDQKRLAGLGNIYVTEALFLTGLRPSRRCHTIPEAQIPPLVENIRRILELGLRHRGVSFYSYRDAEGKKGTALEHLSVYGGGGRPCPQCRAVLKATKVSGRGTVYCPRCQK